MDLPSRIASRHASRFDPRCDEATASVLFWLLRAARGARWAGALAGGRAGGRAAGCRRARACATCGENGPRLARAVPWGIQSWNGI